MAKNLLEMKNINKSFSGVKVLNQVHLEIAAGEVHALMGENGAGKSTMMKILMGIYEADSGEILFENVPYVAKNPRHAMELGISMIHQELNPILDMKVFENIYLGRELRNPLGLVDKKEMIRQTGKLLEELGIKIEPTSIMRSLSVAQCQLIEIVKAISVKAKIIIMDEPTSAITDREINTLFNQIRRLKEQNVAIIYISHKMDEIFQICDRITVLRDGEFVSSDRAENLNREMLIRLMVGRDLKEIYPKIDVDIKDVALKIENWNLGKKVKDVSFELHHGEILGIAGLVGAGRSELVESIFGITKKMTGTVWIDGQLVNVHNPIQAIRHNVALITEDRKFTGLNLKGTVTENITLIRLDKFSQLGVLNKRKERQSTASSIDQLKIKVHSHSQVLATLSGGNQQKVVMAKWLLAEPEIVILDEPTRGIDVGAKRDIYLLMNELVKQGKAVLVISSEIPELMGLCDRIIVMAEGRVTGELDRSQFSQEAILKFASDFTKAI